SSASQPGTRVGRCVRASTHACAVQPSASASPSRSTRYSNRNRAPRRAPARAKVPEPHPRAAEIPRAHLDGEPVVEARRREVADVHLRRQRLDPGVAQARVAAAEALEGLDPRQLEPDEVDGMVRDRLGVGLGEANAHLSLEAEVHGGELPTIAAPRVTRHEDELPTDAALVRRLLAAQFPEWAELSVDPLASSGTVNALYRL